MSQLKQAALRESLMSLVSLRESMNILIKDLFWVDKAETKTWLLTLSSHSQDFSEQLKNIGLKWSPQQLQATLSFLTEIDNKSLHLLQWRDFGILLYFYLADSKKAEFMGKKLVALDELSRKCWLCPQEFNSIHAEKILLFVNQIQTSLANQHPIFERRNEKPKLSVG
ncbi:MAG: hypothetical protein KA116_02725 [Proteobacteria bacterium]|nr:hypothetical protein [Pseudomonadota bacterium]